MSKISKNFGEIKTPYRVLSRIDSMDAFITLLSVIHDCASGTDSNGP